MKTATGFRARFLITLLAFVTLAACSATSTKSADASDSTKSAEISANIRKSLDEAGFKDVTAMHNQSNGMVTLTGQVQADGDKAKAESIAMSMNGGHAVSNQIAVMPMGGGHMGGRGRMGDPGAGHMGDRSRERKPEPQR